VHTWPKGALVIALLGVNCHGSREADASLPSRQRDAARESIVLASIEAFAHRPSCVAMSAKWLPVATPLSAKDLRSLVGDITDVNADPQPYLQPKLSLAQAVPMSRCPERATNPTWYHVTAGPLRVLGPDRVEMVVSANLDGFAEVSICDAILSLGHWKATCHPAMAG
jgi:hypothetical protein